MIYGKLTFEQAVHIATLLLKDSVPNQLNEPLVENYEAVYDLTEKIIRLAQLIETASDEIAKNT